MTSRASTTLERPNPLPKQRLSSMFWKLARGSGLETESRDPEAVVRHVLAVIHALEGARSASDISADSLNFLLQLEHDPYYASPEQTRGGEKDSQSLVYSIGILLFERLTGHHPFVESLSPMHCAVVRDRGQRIGANNIACIPSSLRAVLSTAMSPFSGDRWNGVAELRRELEGFLGRAETVLAPLPSSVRAGSRPRPSRAPTQLHDRNVPLKRREASSSDGTPRPIFADGTGPAGRRRTARSTPPPPPGSPEREQEYSYADIQVKRAESPALSDSINTLVPFDFNALDRKKRSSSRFVVGGLVAVLVTVLATVGLIVFTQATAAAFAPTKAASATANDKADTTPVTVKATTNAAVTATPVAVAKSKSQAKADAKPVPSIFDIKYGGANAVDVARTCFEDRQLSRGVKIGASVLFSSKTGMTSKVFLATGMRITPSQRACLDKKLVGISAGAPPSRGALVTYTLFLTADGGRAHAQRRK